MNLADFNLEWTCKVYMLMPLFSECFVLVFWPEEDAVTTVAEGNIVNTDLRVRKACQVKLGKKKYTGQIASTGKYSHICDYMYNLSFSCICCTCPCPFSSIALDYNCHNSYDLIGWIQMPKLLRYSLDTYSLDTYNLDTYNLDTYNLFTTFPLWAM